MPSAPASLPEIDGLPPGLKVIVVGHGPTRRGRAAPDFAPLALPRRRWVDSAWRPRYRVWGGRGDGAWVEAASAVEAIGKSGVARPAKVVRGRDARSLEVAVIAKGRLEPVPDDDPAGGADAAPAAPPA